MRSNGRNRPNGPIKESRQKIGDESLLRALQYEIALRCNWLLELRGTSDLLSVATGEDATVMKADGVIVYRQIKKKDGGGTWSPKYLHDHFLQTAWLRFSMEGSCRHEFYTNAWIAADFRSGESGQRFARLNPNQELVASLAGSKARAFADSVTFHQDYWQPDPESLLDRLHGCVRRSIQRCFPNGANALELISPKEESDIVARLFQAGLNLPPKSKVCWKDIDQIVRFDQLIDDLPIRAMGNGSFTRLDDFENKRAPVNDEQAAAVFATLEGRNISRPQIDDVAMSLVQNWLSPITKDYRLIILQGSPGSGKTWTLFRLGVALCRRTDLLVLCAAEAPQSERLVLRHVGTLTSQPCVILIDGLFPDWAAHIVNTLHPSLPVPLLVVATADASCDIAALAALSKKRGSRILGMVPVPQSPTEAELSALAAQRGVSLARREKAVGIATTFLHAVHLLSGIEPADHLERLRSVAARPEERDVLTAIWAASSMRVALPRRLLERFIGGGIPSQIRAWLIELPGERFLFEDPIEAKTLLEELYGDVKDEKLRNVFLGLLRRINAQQNTERSFARSLVHRLISQNIQVARELLSSCSEAMHPIIAAETYWALVFTWLPIFAAVARTDLQEKTIQLLTSRTPTNLAEHLLLLSAYQVESARSLLHKNIQQVSTWNLPDVSRLISAIMRIRDEGLQREAVQLFTRWLLDLSDPVISSLLAKRIQEVLALVGDWAMPEDREAVLDKTKIFLLTELKNSGRLKQNWLESYLSLFGHVLSQPRVGLIFQIRRAIVERNSRFPIRDSYVELLEREQRLGITDIVDLGLNLMRTMQQNASKPTPGWIGKFIEVVAVWGKDKEWQKGADAVLTFVEGLPSRGVPIDRVGSLVMSLFGPFRRGPEQTAKRFLRAILDWTPGRDSMISSETGKLLIHVVGFMSGQQWLSKEVQVLGKKTLLTLAGDEGVPAVTFQLFEAVRQELHMESRPLHSTIGLPTGWGLDSAVTNSYLSNVWRLNLTPEEQVVLGNQLISRWGQTESASQYLVEALLRLGQTSLAKPRVDKIAKDRPDYPDTYAHLAICYARVGVFEQVGNQLKTLSTIWDLRRKSLHPYLGAWMHAEIAERIKGWERIFHLACAELSSATVLRDYEDVVVSAGNQAAGRV